MASQMLEVRLADWVCKNILFRFVVSMNIAALECNWLKNQQLQIIDIDTDKVENK